MRKTGWPEGYNWEDYLERQMELVKANRAEEILCDEIATLTDKEEKRRAVLAWKELGVQHTGRVRSVLVCLESDLFAV